MQDHQYKDRMVGMMNQFHDELSRKEQLTQKDDSASAISNDTKLLQKTIREKDHQIDQMGNQMILLEQALAESQASLETTKLQNTQLKQEVEKQTSLQENLESDLRTMYQNHAKEYKLLDERYNHKDYKSRYRKLLVEKQVHSRFFCFYWFP